MSAEIPSRLKPTLVIRQIERKTRRNVIGALEERRCLAWDFTFPDTLVPSHLNIAIKGLGVVACEAAIRNASKVVILLCPLAFEAMRALGDGAVELGDVSHR
jgi:hypothetical protein